MGPSVCTVDKMSAPRIAIALFLVAIAVLAWPRPEDARVRAVVEGAVADFAAGSFRSFTQAFAEDFVDASHTPRVDKLVLVTATRQLRSTRGGRAMGLYSRLVDGEPIEIELDDGENPTRASARFSVEFLEIHPKTAYVDPDAPVTWAIEVDAVLRRGDDGAWRFWRSNHQTVRGERPYR
jgi:hypothetical protein